MWCASRWPAVLLLALLAAGPAVGEDKPRGGDFRPSGPVKINADSAEWQKGGQMVYSGHVRMESGTLKLVGDRLQLEQQDDGEFEAVVTGKPAQLDHAGDPQGNEETREPVTASASELVYRSRSDTVEIVGDARLVRGSDEITGERVRYEVAQRRVQAAGQVEIVIQAPKREGKAREELPSLTPDIGAPAARP